MNVVAYPLSEVGLGVRVKTFRTPSPDPDGDIINQISTPVWNIFVTVNWDPIYTMSGLAVDRDSTEFKQAVQVLPQYHNRTGPTCENIDGNAEPMTTLNIYSSGLKWTFKVVCPIFDPDGFWLPTYFVRGWPGDALDLLVTVNFTSLGISSANFTSDSPLVRETRGGVSIVAGLSNSTIDVISDSQAATMLPNEHLVSGVDAHIRQRFAEANAATLGLSSISKMRTFLVADLVGLRPNPSSTIPRDSNTGSLYLYRQPHRGDWTIVTDYREDSVLSGLSQVGGFWTLVNGLLAFVFGSRLVMIFFGVKPLSTFGLIHSFSRVDVSDSYPRILSEGDLPESQRGVVAFMRDHMLDLGPVEAFNDVESRGERDVEMEERMIPSSPGGRASSLRHSLSSTRLTLGHPEVV
ncbi:hypothetical protein BDZ89DRAFT_551337 [Hymenopellis radicata]|nr:hypothetical protein BDZ89DRAFT_551337 [Hymenopellis radicata]